MNNPFFAHRGHPGPFGRFADGDWAETLRDARAGFGRGPRVDRGLVKLLILSVLQDGPKHGYEVMRVLEQRSQGVYVPSAGAIYPTLQMLEDIGHLRSQETAERKVFALTACGGAYLAEHQEEVDAMWSRFDRPDEESGLGSQVHREMREELGELARTLFTGGRVFRADPAAVQRILEVLRAARKEVEIALRK